MNDPKNTIDHLIKYLSGEITGNAAKAFEDRVVMVHAERDIESIRQRYADESESKISSGHVVKFIVVVNDNNQPVAVWFVHPIDGEINHGLPNWYTRKHNGKCIGFQKQTQPAQYGYMTRDITKPLNGYTVYTDAYWACINGDPAKAIFYNTSPQCNKNKAIMDSAGHIPKDLNWSVVFVPVAYVPRRD